ncbi:delta-60 repeat domain-containing protein [Planctomycetes bacterium Poly30]|uniref:delta-60 repeat domain-containing protein n=1 Tax=Saltatorellus ferox TaxID=2528018 RepID=UPI0011A8329F
MLRLPRSNFPPTHRHANAASSQLRSCVALARSRPLSPALAQQTSSTALPSVPNFDPPRAVPLDDTPDLAFSEVDWVVYASDLEGDRLFLGGNFRRVGPKVGSFIRADPELTEIHKDGPRIEGDVRAVAADGAGGAVIAGTLRIEGTVDVLRLVHVASDGTWQNLAQDLVGYVQDVTVDPATGVAYVVGSIDSVGGIGRSNAAAIDLATGAWTNWTPQIQDNPSFSSRLTTVALGGGRVWIGGKDMRTNGGTVSRNLIVCDPTTGALDPHDFQLNGEVSALLLHGGEMLVGGDFTDVGGISRSRFAQFDAQALSLTALQVPCDDSVQALHVDGNELFLGGRFRLIAGQPRDYAASVDLTTGAVSTFAPDLAWPTQTSGAYVRGITTFGDRVILGGLYRTAAGPGRNNLAAFDRQTSSPVSVPRRMVSNGTSPGSIEDLTISGSQLFAGGNLLFEDATDTPHLGAIDVRTGLVPDNWDAPRPDGTVKHVVAQSGRVVIAGDFDRVSGVPRPGLAMVDAATGTLDSTFVPDLSGMTVTGISCIAANDSSIFVAVRSSWPSTPSLIALDGITGARQALFGTIPASTRVEAMTLSPDGQTLYVGGTFTQIGQPPVAREALAALDAMTGAVLPWAPQGCSGVEHMVLDGRQLRVSAYLDTQLFGLRQYALGFNAVTAALTPWDPQLDEVYGIQLPRILPGRERVVIGGNFFRLAGEEVNSLVAVGAKLGRSLDWRPAIQGTVLGLEQHSTGVFAVGNFSSAGGRFRHSVAAFRPRR